MKRATRRPPAIDMRTALRLAPGFPEAHQGLGNVLAACGDAAAAERHWLLGYRNRVVNAWPYRGPGQPIHVLMLISVANGNIPARVFLDDRLFAVTTVAMEFYTATLALPPHDLVLNAIGDADLCGAALRAAVDLLEKTTAPVINHPETVLRTGRAKNARRFKEIPGVSHLAAPCSPESNWLVPTGIGCWQAGFRMAGSVASPGFHTGQHYSRTGQARYPRPWRRCRVRRCWRSIPLTRPAPTEIAKGRVLIVDRHLNPLHWAISSNWKVHYFTAEMADATITAPKKRVSLPTAGVYRPSRGRTDRDRRSARSGLWRDRFWPRSDGKIVLFEANASMAIVPPPAERNGTIEARRSIGR